MKNLTSLAIHGNIIRKIENKAFYELKELKILDLANQKLLNLGECAFSHMSQLTLLNLSSNHIDSLSQVIICDVTSQAKIDLTENPLKNVLFSQISRQNMQVDLIFSYSKFCRFKTHLKTCKTNARLNLAF